MAELRAAIEDVRGQARRLERLGDALLHATEAGVKQVDLITETGYTREHVRRLTEAARNRRANAQAATPEGLARLLKDADRRGAKVEHSEKQIVIVERNGARTTIDRPEHAKYAG
jgi:hypothetical protein